MCSEEVLKVDKTASSRKYNSVSSTQSQYKKINKIFQNNNKQVCQNPTNKRSLKYKSSTVTEASLHHMQQRSKSTERSGGRERGSTIQHAPKNTNGGHRDSRQKYNYSSYELNRKPNSNNSFSSSSSRTGRTSSVTSSSTAASHMLRNPHTGKKLRSRSEDHLLHVAEVDCCDGSVGVCEECGEESPFYLHDPTTAVGYNRLSDLFPQTSSDDSGLCLNSSLHSPNTNSTESHKRMTEKGFANGSRFSDAYTNKTKASHSNGLKDDQGKNGSRVLSRPRRAAPLPPIPVQSSKSKHLERRQETSK